METLGIYISVPFCRAKCTYCNFASGVSSTAVHEEYVERVCAEIRNVRQRYPSAVIPDRIDSIYLGGGTPSLLDPGLVAKLGTGLRAEFAIARQAEITLECAPGQLDDRSLEGMLAFGVNRISFGVQSLVDQEAQATGRFHSRSIVKNDLERVRAAGVEEVSMDLIAGLPHQTDASWQESLDTLIAMSVSHASVYMLEVDDDSRLGREMLSGGSRYHAGEVPGDEQVAEFYEIAVAALEKAGLAQYEISNFARPGGESRHNLRYWRRQPYLGFGLDAHSMLRDQDGAARRARNPDLLTEYLRGPHPLADQRLSPGEELEEAWFLGLRLRAGVAWGALASAFGRESLEPFRRVVADLAELDLLVQQAGLVRLTPRGVLFSNEVFERFLGVVDSASASESVVQVL